MNSQMTRGENGLRIAMLSIHSSPIGPLGTRDTGGMSVYVRQLSKCLAQRGHRMDIFTCVHGRDQVLYPNVRLIHLAPENTRLPGKDELPTSLPVMFEALDHYRLSQGLEYDLIHSHYWLSGVVGAMAQARWRRPHITMFHTLAKAKINAHCGEKESDVRIAHEKWLARATDRILVPTTRERNNLLRYYHARPADIGVIPCGVDLERFKPMNRQRVRQILGLPLDAPILLYVGRLTALKGLDHLVKAVAELRHRFPELQLLIVGGDGPNALTTQTLCHLSAELNLSRRIRFVGQLDQSQLPTYYNAADLLVLPSHYESFGLVVLEALACGTRVAATPVGVVSDVIRDGFNGAVICAPDYREVANTVAGLLQHHPGKPVQREFIRASVIRFGWRQIADAVAETYAGIVTAHDPALSPQWSEVYGGLPN